MRLLPLLGWYTAAHRATDPSVIPSPHSMTSTRMAGAAWLVWLWGVPALAVGFAAGAIPLLTAGALALDAAAVAGGAQACRVAQHAKVRVYHKGETLFSEGDPSDYFYDIVSGRVKIFKMTPAGKDVILEIFGAGDPLGAVAAYHGRPFPASAVALEDTTCLAIPRPAFFALLEQHSSLVRGLLLGLTVRLVELTNRLAELTGGRVEARFARFFLKLAENTGRPDRGGIFIPMPLSRQELADLTGTTIETAIRIMSRWSRQGLVQTDKDGFVVLDHEALELAAGERA